MTRAQELRQLLNELVNAWPDNHRNPVVDEARQYLETGSSHSANGNKGETWDHLSSEEYKTELWYSL
jgi:phospholipase/lecithinase/hemolysin